MEEAHFFICSVSQNSLKKSAFDLKLEESIQSRFGLRQKIRPDWDKKKCWFGLEQEIASEKIMGFGDKEFVGSVHTSKFNLA